MKKTSTVQAFKSEIFLAKSALTRASSPTGRRVNSV
jgi:hypothetical protein